jgi:signal transduction histidine kinase
MLKSIRDKIVFSHAALSIFIAVLIISISYYMSIDYLKKSQQEKLQFAAGSMAENIRHEVEVRKYTLRIIAESRELKAYSEKHQDMALAGYFSQFTEFSSLSLADTDGIERLRVAGGGISEELRDLNDCDCVRQAISNPVQVIGTVMDQGPGKGPSIMFSYYSETYFSEPAGVLIGEMPLRDITERIMNLDEFRIGETGFPVLVGRDGIVLYHPDADRVNKKITGVGKEAQQLLSSMEAREEGFGRAVILGVDGFVAYRPVKDSGWSLMVMLPYAEFVAAPNRLRNTAIAISFIILSATILITLRLGGGIADNLRRLSAIIENIAGGDMSQRANITSGDEVGRLGESLDMMSAALRDYHNKMDAANEQLHRLSAHSLAVREEERRNISYNVHDELGQALTSIKMDVIWIRGHSSDDTKMQRKTDAMLELIDSTIDTVHRITAELRPPARDVRGLGAAMESEVLRFGDRTGIKCELNVPEEEIVVERALPDTIFRVFQEAITNVARHADATEISIGLRAEEGNLVLEVSDNGKGITEDEIYAPDSFGIMGMRERIYFIGGEISFDSARNAGTRILVRAPLKITEKAAGRFPRVKF